MGVASANRIAIVVLACVVQFAASADDSARSPQIGTLKLVGGDTIEGQLISHDSGRAIRWQGVRFLDPFLFDVNSVESIRYAAEGRRAPQRDASQSADPSVQPEFRVECLGGDVVSGKLAGWTEASAVIESDSLGSIHIRLDKIQQMFRSDRQDAASPSPLGRLEDWSKTRGTFGWQEQGDSLITATAGATLNGAFDLPDRIVVELQLAWEGTADFVVAFGTDPDLDSDSGTDGWRLETAADKLIMLREDLQAAHLEVVADLSTRRSIHLVAFLDQRSGSMHLFHPDGNPIANIDAGQASVGRGIRVINRGDHLQLAQIRIAQWLGGLPDRQGSRRQRIALTDGSMLSGFIRNFDTNTQELLVGDQDVRSAVSAKDIAAIQFSPQRQEPPKPQFSLLLHGDQRVSGSLQSVDQGALVISGANYLHPVRIPGDRLQSLVMLDRAAAASGVSPIGDRKVNRDGRLELGVDRLAGHLVPTSNESPRERVGLSALRWKPRTSSSSARLHDDASGRIVYRERSAGRSGNRLSGDSSLGTEPGKPGRGLNFTKLFLERVDSVETQLAEKLDGNVVHFRSGDVIACRIESIDSSGVRVSTPAADNRLIPHDQVKAIKFNAQAEFPNLDEAKRQRLLTLPRLQKSEPPTQLLCSHNGDFLRCRLISLDSQSLVAETPFEQITIPRDRIAQIVWFHPSELPSANSGASVAPANVLGILGSAAESGSDSQANPYAGLVQAIGRDGKRVTFVPEQVDGSVLVGTNQFIGRCEANSFDVDRVLLGKAIADETKDLAYGGWKLSPAVEPQIMQEPSEDSIQGRDSAFVGKPSPNIKLDFLDGGRFSLADCRGQVVVLDFWATWCAPCIQTIPILKSAIAEFDPELVELISVNVQEPTELIRDVLEKRKFDLNVVLDTVGIASQQLEIEAIPIYFVIAQDGTVDRVFTGGGAETVEKIVAAISLLLSSE